MTQSDEKTRESSAAADEHVPLPTAEARTRERGSETAPASVALDAVTQGARAVRGTVASGLAVLDRPGSLIHAQPPTFAQARERHHQCAGHYQAGLMRWPRLAWGYAHLLVIKPALNFAEWVTESPARCAVALAVIVAVRLWG